jgi:hypothetical protein
VPLLNFIPRRSLLILVGAILVPLITGCSTSFKYTPAHNQAYAPVAGGVGLAIQTGSEARSNEEIRPAWAKNAETIIARALVDEVKYSKSFPRVKIHADTVSLKKYSRVVRFRVLKFECYNQPAFLESAGQEFFKYQGLRGALIGASIPSKYVSEVEIEFEVRDAATQQIMFTKTYSATRSSGINGYQGEKPKVQQTSAALESVITQFIGDLLKLTPAPANY